MSVTKVEEETKNEEVVVESTPEKEVELKEQAQIAVAQLTPEQMFEEWFKEEGNQKMLSELGNELRLRFCNKNAGWFDLQKMMIQTKYKNIEECLQILNLLKLGGLLVAELRGRKEYYKVVMTKDAKLKVLLNQKSLKEKELEEIEKEIKNLQDN